MTVTLINWMGSDLTIVNAARVSYNKQSDEFTDKDAGLIRYLIKNGHSSPFEHVMFQFHVKCPIFVERQWRTHRWSSFNERSGRYTEFDEEFYVPEEFREQVGKSGDYSFKPLDIGLEMEALDLMEGSYKWAYDSYRGLLALGVAKEQARAVLPVGTMTEFYWTVNFRSATNFMRLRNEEHAQKEIRDEAAAVEHLIGWAVPKTMEIWKELGRPAMAMS